MTLISPSPSRRQPWLEAPRELLHDACAFVSHLGELGPECGQRPPQSSLVSYGLGLAADHCLLDSRSASTFSRMRSRSSENDEQPRRLSSGMALKTTRSISTTAARQVARITQALYERWKGT